jgi:AraC family transcriptional regulator of arabinose operon
LTRDLLWAIISTLQAGTLMGDIKLNRSPASLPEIIETTLRFEYHGGGITPIRRPHSTGWRNLPFAILAQNPYGHGRIELSDATYENTDGGACCVAAGVLHRCSLVSEESVSRWTHFRFQVLGGIDLFSLMKPPLLLQGERARRLGDLNEELVNLLEKPITTVQGALQKKTLSLQLLQTLLEGESVNAPDSAVLRAQRLLPALAFVHENTQTQVALEELAELVHLSPSRFHAVFRECFGLPPRDYVLRHRMQRAQELLLTTALSQSEIAERVGYASQFHFSRVFKKVSGATPSDYRRQVRKSIASN